MKRSLLALSVLVLGFVVALRSQDSASVTGVISDPAGAVIPGATVELNPGSGPTQSRISDAMGRYTFPGLAAGDYELKVTFVGFKQHSVRFHLKTGQRLTQNVTLEVGAATESVTVTDSVASMQTQSSRVGRARKVTAPPPASYPIRARMEREPRRGGIRRPSAPYNTEQYDSWVENEFASTKSDPLSTFSVDVDTASYANVRRFLNQGQMPPPGSVRIEELVNYFNYEYPAPEEGKPVSVTTYLTQSPWNPGRQILLVGLRTKPVAWEKLPPSRLTFLIDVSGSMMDANKLPLLKQSLKMLVRNLRPQDSVGIVVYAGNAGVVLDPTPGDHQEKILEAIDQLEAGGSTHGSAGIRAAYALARQSFLKEGNNRVILATDGDFNVGVSSDDELVRIIEKERQSGVFLTVLGYGMGNYKDSKMEKLADKGNGNYAYIDTLSEARKVLVEQMGGTLVTVAKDVKLQIEFNPAQVKSWRLVGYENRVLRAEDFNDDTKDAGELGAGHQVTALYELIPEGSSETTPGVDRLRYQQDPKPARNAREGELAWLKLRYKKPQSNTSDLLQWPVASREVNLESAPNDFRFAMAVAEYGMLLRQSKFTGKANFDHAYRLAHQAVGERPDQYRTEFLELLRRARDLHERSE